MVLDLTCDLVREEHRSVVVDLLRLDEHADLSSGLQCVDLLDPRVPAGELLERLEPLHVVLEPFTACSRPRCGDRIGRNQQDRLDGLRLHLVVVGLDRMTDRGAFTVAAGELGRDLRVGALDLVRHGLAEIVQERRALRGLH